MKKVILWIFFIMAAGFLLRFVIGGYEDDWLCVEGRWVKHGHPSTAMPEKECK